MKLTWTTFKAMNTPTEWRARFRRNRWLLAWCGFAALFMFMLMGCAAFWDRPWLGNFLSAIGTGIAVVLAIIIYVHGQSESAKATREQMEHLQRLNQEEIAEMRILFQRQMDHMAEQTNRQINEYSRETLKVVSKLEESSLLLGELLKRELENSIGRMNDREHAAIQDLQKVESWRLFDFRSQEQKANEVARKRGHLDQVRQVKEYFLKKYDKLSRMFVHNNHLEP